MNFASQSITRKCCYCGRIESGREWIFAREEDHALHSHTCCPYCEQAVLLELGLRTEDLELATAS